MRLTCLLFLLLYAICLCVLGEPKRGPPEDKPNRLPSPKTAKRVLKMVAQNGYLNYEKHMKQRADIRHQMRDRRKERPPPDTPQADWIKHYNKLAGHAWESWKTAETAARANHQLYTVIKDLKKTHRPRYNDFRRWGYSPSSSELTRYTIPSALDTEGSSMLGQRGYRLDAPARSSRTHSPLTHSPWDDWSPWDQIPQRIQGKERKRAMWYYWGRGSTPASERQRRLEKSPGSSQSLGGIDGLSESELAKRSHLARGHQSLKGSKSFGDFDGTRSNQLAKHGLPLQESKSSPPATFDPPKDLASTESYHKPKDSKITFKAYANPAFSPSSKSSRSSNERISLVRSKSPYHEHSPQNREEQESENDWTSSQNQPIKQNFISPFAQPQQQRPQRAHPSASTLKQERERYKLSSSDTPERAARFGCFGRLCGAVPRRGRGKVTSSIFGRKVRGGSIGMRED